MTSTARGAIRRGLVWSSPGDRRPSWRANSHSANRRWTRSTRYADDVFDGTRPRSPRRRPGRAPPGQYIAVNNGNGFHPFTVTAVQPAGLVHGRIATARSGRDRLRVPGREARCTTGSWSASRTRATFDTILFARMKSMADARRGEALLLKGEINRAGSCTVKGPMGQFAGQLSHGAMQPEVITQPVGALHAETSLKATRL